MKYHIIIALYFISFLTPSFGAIDIIGPQWLLISIITLFSFTSLYKELKSINLNIVFFFFALFLLSAILSFLYSISLVESSMNFFRLIILFFSFLIFHHCITKINSVAPLIYIVLIFTFIELFYVFSHLIQNYNLGDIINRDREFAGLAANVNIGAFSTLYKLPILIWIFFSQKKHLIYISGILISLSIFSIFLTGSRGAVLVLLFVFSASVFYAFFIKNYRILSKFLIFFLSPFFLIITTLNTNTNSNNIIQRVSNFSDSSTSNRLSLYSNSFDYLLNNPLGSGLGTYKLSSIPADIPNMIGYQVAYHNHNDFLQYATELGFLGSLLYLSVFMSLLFFAFKSFKANFNPLIYFLSISVIVFLGDSLINFPYSRPILMIQILFLMAVMIYILLPDLHIIKRNFKVPRIVFFVLISAATFSNYMIFESFKDQMILVSGFNSNKFSKSDFKNLESINYTFPNLTVTTLPIASLISLYYMESEDYQAGINLNRANMDVNPYIGLSEVAQSRIFYSSNQLDSAYHYAKIAFDKFPNNQAHSSTYQQVLERLNKFDELEDMFLIIKDNHIELEWSNYLKIISEKEDFDVVNVKYAKEALLLFPDIKDIYNYSNYIIYGKKNVFKSVDLNNRANIYFKNKEYLQAIEFWTKGLELTPYETAFHENITRSYIGLQDFQKAIDYIENLEKQIFDANDQYLYFLGVSFLNIQQTDNACIYLRKSAKKGNKNALALVNSYCN